jgi:hypothetical protein
MNRREFLCGGAATAMGIARSEGPGDSTKIELSPLNADWTKVPIDFVGLSYENGQLYNSEFFAPSNAALIKAFRDLTPKGVLRMGGHLSNITPWEGAGQSDPKQMRGVRHGIEDYWEWPLVDPSVQKNKRSQDHAWHEACYSQPASAENVGDSADAEQRFEQPSYETTVRRFRFRLTLHFPPVLHLSSASPPFMFPLNRPRLHTLAKLHRAIQLPIPFRSWHESGCGGPGRRATR